MGNESHYLRKCEQAVGRQNWPCVCGCTVRVRVGIGWEGGIILQLESTCETTADWVWRSQSQGEGKGRRFSVRRHARLGDIVKMGDSPKFFVWEDEN